jgi:hypothetical protein
MEKHLKEIATGYERAARRTLRVPMEASADGGLVPGRDTADGDPILSRLLLWLDEQQQKPSPYVDVTRFVEEQLHGEDASVLAFELEQRDLVRETRGLADTPAVQLTDAGRAGPPAEEAARRPRRPASSTPWMPSSGGSSIPSATSSPSTRPSSAPRRDPALQDEQRRAPAR